MNLWGDNREREEIALTPKCEVGEIRRSEQSERRSEASAERCSRIFVVFYKNQRGVRGSPASLKKIPEVLVSGIFFLAEEGRFELPLQISPY